LNATEVCHKFEELKRSGIVFAIECKDLGVDTPSLSKLQKESYGGVNPFEVSTKGD